MKQVAFERKKLAANFFANIGVAWFASGVIGIFINRMTNQSDIVISLIWGLGYSSFFLYSGFYVLKLDRKKK